MAGRVIVVSSVNVDLVVALERLPGPGETVAGGRYAQHHGGKGGNQAVAAARLGAATAFVGAVGNDGFGDEARDALAAEGIDLRGLVRLDGESTGVALIMVDATGENSIAVAGGANARLTAEHVRQALATLAPGRGDVLLVGHEIPIAAAREALRIGRGAGAVTILNPAPADGLDPETLELADILTPNRGELALLGGSGGSPAEVASGLLARGPGRAILVSLGAVGAVLVDGDGATALPAAAVRAVDATGAGDALNGALAAGLASGLLLAEAARRAVLAASLAVTRSGAREGMPTVAELAVAVT